MMSKDLGFLNVQRREPGYRPKSERLFDFLAVERRLDESEIVEQASRCMNCGTPFCHGCGCPLGNLIPEFNNYVYRENLEWALKLLLATSPFPEFTARVCPALCEGSCVVGLGLEPVTIRQIELSIVERGFKAGLIGPKPPETRLGRRVAVVGSGPAGLAAADHLNRAGCDVIVFDRARHPGGILRYGIPDFKLEKWVVKRRVELMEAEGVRFETGVEIGTDMSIKYLQSRFHAVLLACGAEKPRDLSIPGRELNGIAQAMDFLSQQNRRVGGEFLDSRKEIRAEDKKVVVIGGGDTGSDCLGTALRQGARSVLGLEILPKPPSTRDESTPWPMWPNVLRESSSHKEGGSRRWSVSTDSFVGDDSGHVTQLNCSEVSWEKPSEGGPKMPRRLEGSQFQVDADLVLLAMGFTGIGMDLGKLGLEVEFDERGFLSVDENNMTIARGIFAAGDMNTGPSLVVKAISDGKRAAEGILRYLK